jgi:hypothetical protein
MQAKAKGEHACSGDGHDLAPDWIGRWLLLENRFSPSASLYLLGSLLSCHYRPKLREAMLKRRKLKGARCAGNIMGKGRFQPLPTTSSTS